MTVNASDSPILISFQPYWLDELVPMWRASFEAGVGVIDPHPLAAQRQYFLEEVLPNNAVRLAILNGELVGFVAASREFVAQLYVRIGFHRRGIGTKLLDWAKEQSAGKLWFYTFQRNQGARAFYERSGFVAIDWGFEPMWRLEDVKYQWSGSV